ncbi:hypothetical protein A966_12481 [Brachyspira hampsonii 30446]|uniref:DUF4261 domain-containing protein n=1 Tax=Brachyspira hampsonii 30446 TaxID=1289135 RepID=A0A2U4EUF5_9SPIR|nr:DUF4261 domain-containing protein [Brachyspira hampsonii]EKV56175.1 hypothetical protein A966_12481 [Brachyspira hampsonii 30446]MBW5395737.1 DUF4261 domain-containing protein [Brachyspira hampsonii]OEJ20293.1 hypothetical protein A9495_01670 [Brachyspira hampsonii]
MNNLIQNDSVIAFILLDDKNFNDFSNQLKEYWDIDITIVSHNNKNTFNIETMDFEYELAPFKVPDKEAEILINYNDIDNETREKILNHKSFLSIKVNGNNTDFKDIALTFSKVCYSIIKVNNVSAVLIGEINLIISNSTYLFEMNEYIKNNKFFPTCLWVRVDVFSDNNGNHAYTEGLKNFGKYEIMAYKTARYAESIIRVLMILSRGIIENNLNLEDGNTMQTDDDYIGMFKFFDNKFIMLEKSLKDINKNQ